MHIVFVDTHPGKPYTVKSPRTTSLGGSQSAICYYVEHLAKLGHELILVNGVEHELDEDGVKHQPLQWFFEQKRYSCDVLVLCTALKKPYIDVLETNFEFKLSISWQGHYGFEKAIENADKYIYHFDVFAFVSEYQRNDFCKRFGLPIEKSFLMLNGISPAFNKVKHTKKTNRCVYFSNPQRGLTALSNLWSKVVAEHPTVQLDIYSSMKTYGHQSDEDYTLADYERLRKLPNVTVHESAGQDELAKICSESAFLVYPTHFVETSCIVALESGAAGVLPLYTDLGVFNSYESECIHYGADFENTFAKKTIEALHSFQRNRKQFDKQSKELSERIREKHSYAKLANAFIENCETFRTKKRFAILRNQEIDRMNNYRLRVYISESMPLFFESSTQAAIFFLKQGNSYYNNPGFTHNAEQCYLQSWKIKESSGSCSNIIQYYDMVGNAEQLFHWVKVYMSKFTMETNYLRMLLKHYEKLAVFEQLALLQFMWHVMSNAPLIDSSYANIYLMTDICIKLATLLSMIGSSKEATNSYRKLIQMFRTKDIKNEGNEFFLKHAISNLIFTNNYDFKDSQYMEECLSYEQLIPIEPYTIVPFTKQCNPRLRIGFLSGDFKNHPVTYILNGFLPSLITYPVDIYIINDTPEKEKDATATLFLHTFVTNFTTITNLSILDSIKAIETLNLDILVDMCGHTSCSTTKIMSILRTKPARVICNYFAYPGTTALKAVDFKLGDAVCLPESSKHFFSEEFQTIEGGMHSYKPVIDLPPSKVARTSNIRFCITNNPDKFSKPFKAAVIKILKALPSSTLVLSYIKYSNDSYKEFLFQTWFNTCGIDRSRIQFVNTVQIAKYFDVYNNSDISLDTFPYNGGTISIESLYNATPYVTLLGEDYVSRIGASILTQIGHPELIATSEDDYVQKVIDLANDEHRISLYHKTLHEDCKKSTLCQGERFAKHFMEAATNMLKTKGFFPFADKEKIVTTLPIVLSRDSYTSVQCAKQRRLIIVYIPSIDVLLDYLNTFDVTYTLLPFESFKISEFLASNDIYVFTQMWIDLDIFPEIVYKSERCIFLNVEQLTELHRAEHILKMMAKNVRIADYSLSNIQFIEEFSKQHNITYNSAILLFPYQFSAKETLMLQNKEHVYEYDIGIINAFPKKSELIKSELINSELIFKRSIVFEKLKTMKFNCIDIVGWGNDRDALIKKCKIILNIHNLSCFNIFEHIRCDRLVFANKLVVSESSYNMENLDIYPFVFWSNYDTIIEFTKNILDNFEIHQNLLEQMNKDELIRNRVRLFENTYASL